jgi:hypothetical protein
VAYHRVKLGGKIPGHGEEAGSVLGQRRGVKGRSSLPKTFKIQVVVVAAKFFVAEGQHGLFIGDAKDLL